MKLTAVDFNPFESTTDNAGGVKLTPVDFDPFAEAGAELGQAMLPDMPFRTSVDMAGTLFTTVGGKPVPVADVDLKTAAKNMAIENRREDSFGDVLAHPFKTTPDRWAASVAGLQTSRNVDELSNLQTAQNVKTGEASGFLPKGVYPLHPFQKSTIQPLAQLPTEELTQRKAISEGKIKENLDAWLAAQEKIRSTAPKVQSESLKDYTGQTVTAIIDMVPTLAAAYATRGRATGQTIGLSIMGTKVFGDKFAEMYQKTGDGDKAFASAFVSSIAEAGTEVIPLHILMKGGGGSYLKRILASMGAEGAQEAMSQALQEIYDESLNKQGMTLGEAFNVIMSDDKKRDDFLKKLRQQFIVGAAAGGGVAVATHPLNKMLEKRDLAQAQNEALDPVNLSNPDEVARQALSPNKAQYTLTPVKGNPFADAPSTVFGEQPGTPINPITPKAQAIDPQSTVLPVQPVAPAAPATTPTATTVQALETPEQEWDIADIVNQARDMMDDEQLQEILDRTAQESEGFTDKQFQSQLEKNINDALNQEAESTRQAPRAQQNNFSNGVSENAQSVNATETQVGKTGRPANQEHDFTSDAARNNSYPERTGDISSRQLNNTRQTDVTPRITSPTEADSTAAGTQETIPAQSMTPPSEAPQRQASAVGQTNEQQQPITTIQPESQTEVSYDKNKTEQIEQNKNTPQSTDATQSNRQREKSSQQTIPVLEDSSIRSNETSGRDGHNVPGRLTDNAEVTPKPAKLKDLTPVKRANVLRAARREYFTPGSIVEGYGGKDRVISYNDGGTAWDVTVEKVEQKEGKWVAVGPKRIHATEPSQRDPEYTKILDKHVSAAAASKKSKTAKDTAENIQESDTKSTPEKAASSQAVQSGKKIEDFGETLQGARKHYAQAYRDKIQEAETMDVAAQPLSKTWPEPDYLKLLDGGTDPWTVAFVHAARDEVPTKPQKGWKLKGWVEQVTVLRKFSNDLLDGTFTVERLLEKLNTKQYARLREEIGGRIDLYMAVGHEQSMKGIRITKGMYSIHNGVEYKPAKTIWTVEKKAKATSFSNWPQELAKGDTKEEAIADFKKKMATKSSFITNEPVIKFDIYSYRDGSDKASFFVGKKLGKRFVDLKQFDTAKEAREYKATHYDELVAELEKYKDIPNERRETNEPRVGVDHRNGADVTPLQFSETFGFRGVQFGNYVEGARRHQDLNNAYDALMDLAGILGVSPKALSLNGELGLAFGARGTGGKHPASAHYESGNIVINLTKRAGAGSLAHEWFHGLDNYFSRMRGKKTEFVTNNPEQGGEGIRNEMVAAFNEIMRAIRSTALSQRSRELDDRRSKPYWSTNFEMAARSFESYVIAKLHDQEMANDYLANIVPEEVYKIEDAYPYPTAAEVPVIRAAFDSFFNTIQSRDTEKGVALYSLPPAEQNEHAEVAEAYLNLAQNEDFFRYPRSRATSLADIAKEVDPDYEVREWKSPKQGKQNVFFERDIDGKLQTAAWVIRVPVRDKSGEVRSYQNAYVTEREDDTLHLNVFEFKEGTGGSAVYSIVANYAYNNGKVFIGDTAGITEAGARRRVTNLLSSALKFGTTAHIRPHPWQVKGVYNDIPAVPWREGDDLFNIRSLIKAEHEIVVKAIPEAADMVYDVSTDNYRNVNNGRPVNQVDIQSLLESRGARAAQIGSAVLKRTAIENTFLRAPSESVRRRILAEIVRGGAQRVRPAGLKDLAHSLNKPASGGFSVSGVEKIIAGEMLTWGKGGPTVTVVENIEALPPDLTDTTPTDAEAVYDGQSTIYLVASNLSAARVLPVLAHEAVGHYGMERMLGSEFQPILMQVQWLKKSGDTKINDIAKEVYRRYKGTDTDTQSREIIAVMAERGVKHPLLAQIVAAIKKFLRKLGFKQKFSATELEAMVVKAARQLSDDQVKNTNADRSSAALFSRKPEETLKAIDEAAQQQPTWKEWKDRAKAAVFEDRRPAWLGTLTRLHLADVGKDVLPGITQYVRTAQQMDADRNHLLTEVAKVAQPWAAFQSKDPASADAMVEIMADATIAGVDPAEKYKSLITEDEAKAKIKTLEQRARMTPGEAYKYIAEIMEVKKRLGFEKKREAAYPALQRRFAHLPDEAQRIYREVRDVYRARFEEMQNTLLARIERSGMSEHEKTRMKDKLRVHFESATVEGPYFPLARFGDYWVSVVKPGDWTKKYFIKPRGKQFDVIEKGKRKAEATFNSDKEAKDYARENTTETEFHMFDGAHKSRNFAAQQQALGYKVVRGKKLDNLKAAHGASEGFVSEVVGGIMGDMTGPTAERIKDDIWQLFLTTLPDMSVRKHFVHRQKIKGYSQDALRAFADQTFHGSYQLARLRHSDVMDTQLRDMEKSLRDTANPEKATDIFNELKKRHEWAMNPQGARWANVATQLGFVWYLGLTPAAAMINTTQTAFVALPVLGAEHGWGRASAELIKAGRDFFGGHTSIKEGLFSVEQTLKGEELKAIQELGEAGVIDKTLAHDLAAMSETPSTIYSDKQAKAMHVISYAFHHAERFNREVTALAAYRLARKTGKTHSSAVDDARRVTYESHFDYSSANKARFMQSNAAKVFLIFKQYSLNMTYLLVRNVHQSVKGQSAEVRSLARRKLAGVLGMHALAAGAYGLPLMWLVAGIMDAIFDDEDEPWDFYTEFRNFLADYLGSKAAEGITKGAGNAAGVDLSSRVGLNGLWFRGNDKELEGRDLVQQWVNDLAGPVAGIAASISSGFPLMKEGHVMRGIEAMTPKAVRDGLKMLRYADEGVQDLHDNQLIDELNPAQMALQGIGFTPSEVSSMYDAKRALNTYKKRIKDRRDSILNRWWRALQAGDTRGVDDALNDVADFNEKNPTQAITLETLKQSAKARVRAGAEMRGGVRLNKRERSLEERVRFGAEE